MTDRTSKIQRAYPRTVRLENGREVPLRWMTAADAERILAFARSLPSDDLLFLRTDITDSHVVAEWVTNLDSGKTVTVLAETDGEIAGYASLHHNEVTWQRHLGEMRIQVGPSHRTRGLGHALAGEIFQIARELGLRKIVVQMTSEQKAARALVERLGFRVEALLQDFVIDRAGRTHDVVLLSYDLTGLTEHID